MSEVKRVTEDFWGAMERPDVWDHSEMDERWLFRISVDSGILLEEWKTVMSSA